MDRGKDTKVELFLSFARFYPICHPCGTLLIPKNPLDLLLIAPLQKSGPPPFNFLLLPPPSIFLLLLL